MVWFFKWFMTLLVYHCPLGLGMGPFATIHVLVVELYFLSVAWLVIRSIVRFFKFLDFRWFPKFLYLPFGPSPFSGLSLDFGVTSFEHFPFGPFLIMLFVHAHPIHFLAKSAKLLLFIFLLTTQHVIHLMW